MKKPPTATAVASGSDPERNAVAALATTVVAACPPGLIFSDYTEAPLQNHSDVATTRNGLAGFLPCLGVGGCRLAKPAGWTALRYRSTLVSRSSISSGATAVSSARLT